MYSQVKKTWCGPTAISNALLAVGQKVSQKRAGKLCGTTDEGTDEHQLMMGLDLLGVTYEVLKENARKVARAGLDRTLLQGQPALLCVDDWGHWVTVIAPPLGARYPYVDPVSGDIKLIHWRTLERRWAASARLQTELLDTTYYLISIRT